MTDVCLFQNSYARSARTSPSFFLFEIIFEGGGLFEVQDYPAGAAAALGPDGDFVAFGKGLEKFGGLIRACDFLIIYPYNHIPAAQPHFVEDTVPRQVADSEAGRFLKLHVRCQDQLLQ